MTMPPFVSDQMPLPDADEAKPELIVLARCLHVITEVRHILQRLVDQMQETGSANVSQPVPQLDDSEPGTL